MSVFSKNLIVKKAIRSMTLILIFCLVSTVYGQKVKISGSKLKVGEVIKKELKAKEDFYLEVKKNEYVKVAVEQQGIDVVVKVYDSEGKQICEVDSPNGTDGIELVEIVTSKRGVYRIEVASTANSRYLGRYEIKLEEQRAAKEIDRKRIKFLQETAGLTTEAILLYQKNKYKESEDLLKQVIDKKIKFLGMNDIEVANSLSHLARVYYSQGRYGEAEVLYKQAVETEKLLFGSYHPHVITNINKLVEVYHSQGKYNEAESLSKQAIEIGKETIGLNHPLTATSFNNLGHLYFIQGKYSEAESLFKQVLEIRKDIFSFSHPDTAISLNSLALVYKTQGKYSEAESLFKQVLEIRKDILGLNNPYTATSINNLAQIYREQGKYNDAEPLYLQSLEIIKTILGVNHPATATSLNNLASLYQSQGKYNDAEPLYLQSLEIIKAVLGTNHHSTAISLNNLASLYSTQGKYTKAEPLYKQSLEISKTAFGLNHPDTATNLHNLASLYLAQGRHSEAEPLYKQALEIKKAIIGLNHSETANSLDSLAGLYSTQGRYNEAEPLYKQVLEIRKNVLGLEHPDTAAIFNNLAGLYSTQGRYDEAEPLYKQALEIKKSALGTEHPDTAIGLNNLAQLYLYQKRYKEAELLYLQSLEIMKSTLGLTHSYTASGLNNLAQLYDTQGRYSEAESLYRQSLEIMKSAFGFDHPLTATSLNNLASLYSNQKKYDQAEPLYLQSLEIRKVTLGANHPDTAQTLYNCAKFYIAKGDSKKGLEYKIEADNAREREYTKNLLNGSENQKLLYLKKTSHEFDATISMHLQLLPENAEAGATAMTAVLRRKGRALDVTASSIELLRARANEEDRELLNKLASAKASLSTVILKGTKREEVEKYKERVKELEEQVETLESEISQKSGQYRAQIQAINLENVTKAVPEKALLVEFTSYQPYDAKKDKLEPNRYAVYTLDNKGKVGWADLGEVKEIDRLAGEFRDRLKGKKNSRVMSQKLYQKLMKPIVEIAGKRERLFLSPDGSLNLIPFAALLDSKGKYLVEKYKLTYLTSGRDLLRLQAKTESGQTAFIFANPDYGQGEGLILKGRKFTALKRLPATAEEGKSIKMILKQAELRMDREATESSIKQVSRPEILHIATHGYFMEDLERKNVEESRILVQQNSQDIDIEKEKKENPLLRSYLFFAGANEGGDKESDGTLTALEAANLDLLGTKLVVLSACDTAVGEAKNGEGVYGLRRALVLAGSESQMMSLWQVSDKATKELMVDYYTKLKAGEGRSDALQNVQLKMLHSKQYSHPYYWASFIQSGQWAKLER